MRVFVGVAACALAFGLCGCKSEAEQYREEFEKALPSVKPQLEVLSKIGAAPVAAPKCEGAPDPPILVLANGDPTDKQSGSELMIPRQFTPPNAHPCFFLHMSDVKLLNKPFDPKESHAGQPGPHRNGYIIAVEGVQECFEGAHTIAMLKQTKYVAPKMDSETTFTAGTIETDVILYSMKGEPKCVSHFATVSSSSEKVEGKSKGAAEVGLAANLGTAHEEQIRAFLGIKRN